VYSRGVDAESCPDEDALRRAVATRVGYDSFFPWAKRTVIATISRRDGAFVATVDLIDERGGHHGGHQLRTEGACADLLDTVALAVAIAIDPQLLLAYPSVARASPEDDAAPAAPTQPADTAPVPAQPPPAQSAAEPPPTKPAAVVLAPQQPGPEAAAPTPSRASGPVAFEGSLGGTAAIGVTLGPSYGGTLGAAVLWRRFSLGLEGFIAAPSTRAATGSGSISSWPLLGTLAPCVYLGPVFGCALAQTGAVFYASESGPGALSKSSQWWAAGGRAGVVVRVRESFLVRFRVDILGVPSPANVHFNDDYQGAPSFIAGSLGVDAVVRFP
jgi:hypothetical protein